MTSIFTADSSTQGTGGFTNTKTFNTKDNANIKFFSKSGIYNSGDNTIKIFTNYIDALTIDANQKVTCDGSLITNITYSNITGRPLLATVATSGLYTDLLSKPTNFQADWNSTVINIPSALTNISNVFITSNVIQNSVGLVNYNNLTGTPTNFQADWNSTIINRPSALTNISNIFITSNVIQNSSNLVNYNNLTGKPDLSSYATTTQLAGKENTLTFNSPFTRTTNTIGLSYDSSLSLSATNQLKVANPSIWNIGINGNGGTIMYYNQGTSGINPIGTGFVGIGLSVPNYRLDVGGIINSSSGFNISASSTTNSALTWNNYGVSTIGCAGVAGSYSTSSAVGDLIISADTGKKLILQTGNSAGDFIINGGNVGLGITNPLRKLHLNALTDVGVYLQMTNSASGSSVGNGCILGMDATLLNFVISNSGNADIYLNTNGSKKMRIKSGGNVGIGNNAPIGQLCVGNSSVVGSDGNIVIGKCHVAGSTRQFRIGLDTSYNFCIGDYGGGNTAGTWLNTQFNMNYSTGNIGIGVAQSSSYKLNVNGVINTNSSISVFLNGTQMKVYSPQIWRTALATGNGRYYIGIQASNALIKISLEGSTNYNIYYWTGMVLNTAT